MTAWKSIDPEAFNFLLASGKLKKACTMEYPQQFKEDDPARADYELYMNRFRQLKGSPLIDFNSEPLSFSQLHKFMVETWGHMLVIRLLQERDDYQYDANVRHVVELLLEEVTELNKLCCV